MTTPDPTAALPASPAPLADWGDRVIATLIDLAIVAAAWLVLWIVVLILGAISDTLGGVVFFLGWAGLSLAWLYFGYMEGEVGQSPGKRILGLRIVNMSGDPVGGGMGIVRRIAHILDGFCFVGYLLPLFDAQKQTFADKIMSTVVVKGLERRSFGLDVLAIRANTN